MGGIGDFHWHLRWDVVLIVLKSPKVVNGYLITAIPTTIKTMDVNVTYLRVLIIGIGSTIIFMVVEAQGSPYTLGCIVGEVAYKTAY